MEAESKLYGVEGKTKRIARLRSTNHLIRSIPYNNATRDELGC